ncbi:MAG TPA: flagellar assembly protein FliH [Phenylobacterium sp.]|nr:flagellar assembly protein FliH [Phenylobacterium sp.]
MADQQLQRFGFDTVFDGVGDVAYQAPRPKRSFSPEEVEAIRQSVRGEAEQAALAGVAARQADALDAIAQACGQALPKLAEVAHAHRVNSAELALACARAIAAAALDRFPEAPVRAALESLAREIEAAPRLIVTADPELAAGLQAVLEETAKAVGYPGGIQVRADAGFTPHAFNLDFGDGSASFDPQAAAERVSQALHAALAAEGLHAEPLIPGSEAPASHTSES